MRSQPGPSPLLFPTAGRSPATPPKTSPTAPAPLRKSSPAPSPHRTIRAGHNSTAQLTDGAEGIPARPGAAMEGSAGPPAAGESRIHRRAEDYSPPHTHNFGHAHDQSVIHVTQTDKSSSQRHHHAHTIISHNLTFPSSGRRLPTGSPPASPQRDPRPPLPSDGPTGQLLHRPGSHRSSPCRTKLNGPTDRRGGRHPARSRARHGKGQPLSSAAGSHNRRPS